MTTVKYEPGRYLPTDAELAAWTVDELNDRIVAIEGKCPSCGHGTKQEVHSYLIDERAKGMAGPNRSLPQTERMTRVCECACNGKHPDPKDPQTIWPSCGRWWLATIRLTSVGPDQRVMATRDESLLGAAQAARQVAADAEIKLRSSAEKWIGAITALIGLFGLSGVLTGANAFTNLPGTARWVAGIAAAAAFLTGGVAIFMSYRAAYGWPVKVNVTTDAELQTWYQNRREDLDGAKNRFKIGVCFAAAAAVALAVTVGCVWFWPTAAPAHPLVMVTRVDDSQVCGTLLDSSIGQRLRIRRTNGDVQTVNAAEIRSLQAVTQCSP